MPALRFNIPHYPLKGRFSDPFGDYDEEKDTLAELAARPPKSLHSQDLYYLFNSYLPAGSFEEMAPYLPHALRLLQEDNSPQCVDEGEFCQCELLDSLVCWCHVERHTLMKEEHQALLAGMQEAFMTLFASWTSNTEWQCDRNSEPCLRNSALIDTLLSAGEEVAGSWDGKHIFPWLRAERYLAHITALDSVPHAAWTLWVSHGESTYMEQRFTLPAATRRKAVDMVEEWLLTEGEPEDALVWDPVLLFHRERLYLFPDAP